MTIRSLQSDAVKYAIHNLIERQTRLMNTETGQVKTLNRMSEDERKQLEMGGTWREIDPMALSGRARTELMKYGVTTVKPRSKCPCGSMKRFKSCCMRKKS